MANHNFVYPSMTDALPGLCSAVLGGAETGSRNGRTRELIATSLTLTEPWRREVFTPGRRALLPAQIAETMWLLAGRDDIEWLGHYLPRAGDFSDDGKVWRGAYGPRIRAWKRRDAGDVVDQLAWCVDLLRREPLTRRAVMSIYDPDIDSADGSLDVPCNAFLQFVSRLGKLDMIVSLRSNDLLWGLSGINAFAWSTVQEVVAGLLGIGIGRLHMNAGSLHLYQPYWEKAQRMEPTLVNYEQSPRFQFSGSLEEFDKLVQEWFAIEEGLRTGRDLYLRVADFPEPMLRSWLKVIGWWWTGDYSWLRSLKGTELHAAAHMSPLRGGTVEQPKATDPFIEYVVNLHAKKSAAYGNSWKRRGELGIVFNISRKIDRLGVAGAGDTASDTVVDALVYAVLYRLWLLDFNGDQDTHVAEELRKLPSPEFAVDVPRHLEWLVETFNLMEKTTLSTERIKVLDGMILTAASVARQLWAEERGKDWDPDAA